jgi:hypothetical protein
MSTLSSAFTSDPRLPQLTALLRRPPRFNILRTLGLNRQEVRHSDLLAVLLDPRQPHGLGARVARALLDLCAPLVSQHPAVAALRLTDLTVQREWNFIDVLLEAPADRLAVIIENKVDSDEHSDQLDRYYRLLQKQRPGWHIIGIYLTIDGAAPASALDQQHYAPLGYADLAALLADIADDPTVAPDVQTFVRHYVELIRSDLVPELTGDAGRMARELYIAHRATVDALIQARDARQKLIQQTFDRILTTTINDQPGLLQRDDFQTNASMQRWFTRFAPVEWYTPTLQVGQRWTRSKLVLMFQFYHDPEWMTLTLTVGPAPRAPALRQACYALAEQQRQPFDRVWNDPSGGWFDIYVRRIFTPETNYFAAYDDDAIRRAIQTHWEDFLQRDLPVIRATIRHEILGRTW